MLTPIPPSLTLYNPPQQLTPHSFQNTRQTPPPMPYRAFELEDIYPAQAFPPNLLDVCL
ncbi:unnamed protein product [Choristocarpus tenellus]